MLTRAQKRMADAARDLARVRRLALPDVFARVAVATPPTTPALMTAATPAGEVNN
jgi:hypothetical protein